MPAPLKSYIDRILNVLAEIDDLGGDKKEIYKELAGDGYDRSVVSQVVGHIRKKAAKPGKFAEQSALFDVYLTEYEGTGTRVATHAARELPDHDPVTGVIIEPDATPAGAVVANGSGVTGGESAATGGREKSVSSQAAEAIEPGMVDPGVGQTPTNSESEAAMLPQTGAVETLVANSQTVGASDGATTSSAGTEGEADRQPIPPPVAIPPVAPATVAAEAGDRSAVSLPAAPVVASNVTAFRTHNPETHFLSSKGLQRLHGCLNAEVCAGSRSKLCFTCSTRHEGPAYSDGVA